MSFAVAGSKGGRASLRRKVLKIIPPRPGEVMLRFPQRSRSHCLFCSLHSSSIAICRDRKTAAWFLKLARATEDHSWGIPKIRTKGGISQ